MPPREFLLFRLWGPMASWGDIAVGERRTTWGRPSRSAILGLVGAALGIDRADGQAHARLENELALAIRVDNPGRPLRDYHTAQAPSQRRGVRHATRREEVADKKALNTVLSERSYYTGMNVLIALWLRQQDASIMLGELAARIAEPVFPLHLGRKACPLGLPPAPQIVQAQNLDEAFSAYAAFDAQVYRQLEKKYVPAPITDTVSTYWLDEADARSIGIAEPRICQRVTRRDSIRDRIRWLFDDRREVEVRGEHHDHQ